MPQTAERIWKQLNLPQAFADVQLTDIETWGGTPAGLHVGTPEQLFPRIEVEKEDKEAAKAQAKQAKQAKAEKKQKQAKQAEPGEVTIDDFKKLELRVAKVLKAEKVEKADKLLKLTVDLGTEQREVVSGIAKNYTIDDIVGKNVILVANLKPAKIRGVVSHGMILAAADNKDLKVVSVDMPAGTEVH